ncbi:hypothetical protein HPB52_025187 [Rhipicephalus sanguineus]|uniref:Transposase n=1 Tax=Rhipicephalus sanguineus TaxID=34632 RepID=A0A9D4TDE0_RHISA|nr:hypothetical protein HPB52_025187 [Rhipicephalus sanguineus]
MLGVGRRTVFRVREEVKAQDFSGGKLTTPSRKRPRNAEKTRRSAKFDSFTLCALRSSVHDFFLRNEIPTVEEITAEFSERMEHPPLRRCTVRRLLAEIGFKHEKRSRNSLLIDRDDITDWRNRYLRDMVRYRAEGRKIFYLDETWVTSGHTRSIVWTDTVVQKRGRLLILTQRTGALYNVRQERVPMDKFECNGCTSQLTSQDKRSGVVQQVTISPELRSTK